MKRIHIDPVRGRQRILVEFTSHDIFEVLDNLMFGDTPGMPQFPATRALVEVLEASMETFGQAQAAAAEGETSGTAVEDAVRVGPLPDGDGDVLIHLPHILYVDTQVWSVDVGVTREALTSLHAAIGAHLCSTPPTRPANPLHREEGWAPAPTPGDEQLRAAFRRVLDRFIDPDDDTMPRPDRVDGGYTWSAAERVIDDLVAAVTERLCGQPHYDYPETLCAEPAGHYRRDVDPHAAPLVVDGRECGGVSWDEPAGASAVVPVPVEVLRALVKVAAHVSAGRGAAFAQGPYPDAAARRALGALDDAGLLDQFRGEDAP